MNAIVEVTPAAFPTPWAARAFAIVRAAVERGLFEQREFQQSLIAAIGSREAVGGCISDETAYYDCWIEALTGVAERRGVVRSKLAQAEATIRQRFADRHAHAHAHVHADEHEHEHEHEHTSHCGELKEVHVHEHPDLDSLVRQTVEAHVPRPIYVEKAQPKVSAAPYPFPASGSFRPGSAALVVIDMQRDFCDPEGYMGRRGSDVSAAQALIPKIVDLCAAARSAGMRVIYTREGHSPDLGDAPASKLAKTKLSGAEIGSAGALGRLLVRGEEGWGIVKELTPLEQDVVFDKVGTGAFYATELEHRLRVQGIEQLVLVGVTTGVCVSTTAREASDRGFHVLVVGDCCAEPDQRTHEIALELLQVEGGYIAAVAKSSELLSAIVACSGSAEACI